jgi:predicted double-glycine peptidase
MRVSLILLAMLFASAAHAERPVRSLLEMRQEGVIIQQWDTSCGAAALATILTYDKGFPITEPQVARGMLRQTDPLKVKYRGGFSLLDMKRFAAQIGFESDGYSGMTLADLTARAPMIIPIRVRGYNHFIVVRKVTNDHVDIADPGFGRYRMRRASFARIWRGIGFEVKKTDRLAARNE